MGTDVVSGLQRHLAEQRVVHGVDGGRLIGARLAGDHELGSRHQRPGVDSGLTGMGPEGGELDLERFHDATVIAISHDRTFLATFDRFVMITGDGEVFDLPDHDLAMPALAAPDQTAGMRLARNLTA